MPCKVIFLGPGCGHVAYQLGFMGGLLDDNVVRKSVLRTGACFGGVSSGALAAAYAMATAHGVGTMRDWYKWTIRKGYEAIARSSTMVMGGMLEWAGHLYHETCAAATDGSPPWLRNYVCAASSVLSLRPCFYCSYETADDFAKKSLASSYVPLMMGFRPWQVVQGRRVIDGYAAMWRMEYPDDNYMLVTFLPTLPASLRCRTKHHLQVDQFDTSPGSLLVKCWPWGDPEWADAAFDRGWADALRNREALRAKLLAFLEDGAHKRVA